VPELVRRLEFEDPFSFPVSGRKAGRPNVSPRDFARFGLLYLHGGRWRDEQVLDRRLAQRAVSDPLPLSVPRTAAKPAAGCDWRSIGGGANQTDHEGGYSWLWWVNAVARDGRRWWPDAPEDMFLALGHCGRRGLAVLPGDEIIVSWNDARELHCDRELGNRAFRALADAVRDRG
jgi:CubicO group peptidase (beta-lactamase class C family)